MHILLNVKFRNNNATKSLLGNGFVELCCKICVAFSLQAVQIVRDEVNLIAPCGISGSLELQQSTP